MKTINSINKELKTLHKFKKPLTKVFNSLVCGYDSKYIDEFEYYFMEQNDEVDIIMNKIKNEEETINNEIQVNLLLISRLLELKENLLKEELKKYLVTK